MRKTVVIVLVLMLLCWDCVLFAVANRSPARVADQLISTEVLSPMPVKTVAAPGPTRPSPTFTAVHHRSSSTSLPVPPASNSNGVQAAIPKNMRGSVFFRGSIALHEIALTFDDGPNPFYTPQILAILQQYKVHATFFCIGRQVQSNPSLVQHLHAAGELVADHTWDHFDLTKLSLADVQWQLRSTAAIIKRITGAWTLLFRPPYGVFNDRVRAVAVQLGLLPVMWDVDTNDWRLPGSGSIIRSVLTEVSNGSIILMHDGGGNRSETVQALPTIITLLRQQGFRFVTVQQLLIDTAHVPV